MTQSSQPDNNKTLASLPKPVRRRKFNGLTIEERQKQRRIQLMEAGLELYGTLGFYNVKIKDICKEAKLTERYFYESFPNAETLFHVIFKQQVEKLHQEIFISFLGASVYPESILERGVMSFLQTIQNDRRMARILYVEAMSVPDPTHYSTMDVHFQASNLLEKVITMIFLKDTTLTASAKLLIDGLTGYCTRVCLAWVNQNFSVPIEDVARTIVLMVEPFYKILNDDTNADHHLLFEKNSSQ